MVSGSEDRLGWLLCHTGGADPPEAKMEASVKGSFVLPDLTLSQEPSLPQLRSSQRFRKVIEKETDTPNVCREKATATSYSVISENRKETFLQIAHYWWVLRPVHSTNLLFPLNSYFSNSFPFSVMFLIFYLLISTLIALCSGSMYLFDTNTFHLLESLYDWIQYSYKNIYCTVKVYLLAQLC